MRDDTIIDYGVTNEELLSNAPAKEAGGFKVRRVL
jgi:Asp-tRNA(Asn)/Glu-tRNA(Gln) amidotransferase C subunit